MYIGGNDLYIRDTTVETVPIEITVISPYRVSFLGLCDRYFVMEYCNPGVRSTEEGEETPQVALTVWWWAWGALLSSSCPSGIGSRSCEQR